jgi:hypothetical protein
VILHMDLIYRRNSLSSVQSALVSLVSLGQFGSLVRSLGSLSLFPSHSFLFFRASLCLSQTSLKVCHRKLLYNQRRKCWVS